MTMQLGALIGTVGTLVGILFGYLGWRQDDKKELQADAAGSGELRSDINYIKRGIDDIRVDMKVQEKRVTELAERVTRVEESTKQAHKRIDKLEE